ncbi:cytochrome P450 [Rhodocollybia butyracea]|uniref:Cytochrome P450 n=1 Tax=Rhodocollybia butyracea TaxID=206335 RepID=A0A9P5U1G4_9AGAR|nr:cytochrome P450 [Rhodocollybia butyracea]
MNVSTKILSAFLMMLTLEPIHALVLFSSLVFIKCLQWKNSRQLPLPPGPRKLPILGNLLDIPRKGFIWLEYGEMCRKHNYPPEPLGNSIIVLDSAQAVSDLLEKRSSLYSSRPSTVMFGELMGWGITFVLRPYDELWKAQRRIFTHAIPPSDTKRFHSKQITATHDLLRVLAHSDNIMKDLHQWAAVFIMDVAYGIQGKEAVSFLKTAIEASQSIAIAGTPGAFLVDHIPILKYVPEWFPGADFKRKAREWNLLRVKMTEDTFRLTKERMAAGTATPSLASVALEQMDLTKDIRQQEELIKATSLSAYSGSINSPYSGRGLGAFILAMLMNPDVQVEAQRELDKVLAPGDLPTFSLKSDLPYISAIVREVLRYQPVAPVGFPHLSTKEDVYKGYLIPKGSIIMPNVWSILHNEKDYPDPDQFNPSRYLDANGKIDASVKDPTGPAFGFGRRACPGKDVALASLWIGVASILACYSIEPEVDQYGNLMERKGEWYSGPSVVNHPLPFKCRFISRSKEVETSLNFVGKFL